MEGGEIEPAGLVVGGEVDVVPDPVVIDCRIDAVVLKEGDGDGGDGGGFYVGEGALEDGETGDADDGFDFAGLDERHDDGRTFGDEDGVAEALGFFLKILDGAEAAAFAEQAEFIEGRGAFVFDAQAFRHEEETALEGDGGHGLTPHLIAEADGGVVEVDIGEAGGFEDFPCVHFELIERHGRNRLFGLHVFADVAQEGITLRLRLRDVLLRRAHACERGRRRAGNFYGLEVGGHQEFRLGRCSPYEGFRVVLPGNCRESRRV